MTEKNILGTIAKISSKSEVLEKIERSLVEKNAYSQVVSLNPEIIIETINNISFKKVVETSQTHILDGVGIVIAAQILYNIQAERLSGVDLMQELCEVANKNSLSVVLIGGGLNLADKLAKCQNGKYPRAKFYGFNGYVDKNHPTKEENERLFSIVADLKPSLVFVAFGSPFQELWLDRHKDLFPNSVCMGVGGAFDFLSGKIPRAPLFIRKLGLEWLFRLIHQPWRIKRQTRLFEFILRVSLQKLTGRV